MGNNGVQIIIAATILGVCMLGGAFLVSQSVDRAAAHIPQIELAMKNMQTALVKVAEAKPAAAPAPAAKPRRRGPDPEKVYQIATAANAFKGPASAKVTIAEFSDFQ